MRMRRHTFKAILKAAASGAALLLLGVGSASAATAVSITAGPTPLTLPDGTSVPMWGYSCTNATDPCKALNLNAPAGAWSPIVITVQGTTASPGALDITLTNGLSFN